MHDGKAAVAAHAIHSHQYVYASNVNGNLSTFGRTHHMKTFQIFIVPKLFFLYIHLTNKKAIQSDYVMITLMRCSLYSIDLAFTFLPSDKLKQEVWCGCSYCQIIASFLISMFPLFFFLFLRMQFHRVGLIIHNSFMVEITNELQKTVTIDNNQLISELVLARRIPIELTTLLVLL